MKLESQERITEISFNEQDGTAAVYTHNNHMRNRLETLARDYPKQCQIIEYTNEGRGIRCTVPKDWIKLHRGWNGTITEADRKARSERMKKNRYIRKKSVESPE